jgi:predicted metal-binding membrane protein
MAVKGLAEHFRRPPWPALLGVSAGGHMLWLLGSIGVLPAAICVGGDGLWAGGVALWATAAATLTLNPPATLLTGWVIMLVAMMPLLLAAPIVHLQHSSLARRRGRAVACFVAGYGMVWVAMAVPLGCAALLAHTMLGEAALPAAVAGALAWSASPLHRRLLNRAHRLRPLSLFNLRADRDCTMFGIEHGMLCAAACWAWMLVPLLAGGWHYIAMLATGIVLLAERLSLPAEPRWRLPPAVAIVLHPRARAFPRASVPHHG